MSTLVTLGKSLAIDTAKPLPIYDNGPAKAFAALDSSRARGKNLVAYICDPSFVARRRSVIAYRGMAQQSAAYLVTTGVVFWPPTGDERFVIVYEHNFFGPLLAAGIRLHPTPWRDYEVIDMFIKPLISVLVELEAREIIHGSIRLSNIFLTQNGKTSPVVLGDAFSCPAAYAQENIYLTAERALAHPLARGEGSISDDIYAFGVSLSILLRSSDPMANLKDHEVIDYKMQHGSYAALVGKERFSGHVQELLRGCLQDSIDLRWTVADLQAWCEGRRVTPQHTYRRKRAVRPIEFCGKKYFFSRDLAYGISQNMVQAQALIESGEIVEWLERSVGDVETAEQIRNYIGRDFGKSKTRGNINVLSSAIITILEPQLPVFYKDNAYYPDGLGAYFANLIRTGQDTSEIAELIFLNVMTNYLFLQPKTSSQVFWIKMFESCRSSLGQVSMGQGVERCLYLLCRDAQCMGSKLARHFVMGPEDMMRAFEDLCLSKGQSGPIFLDRHSIAFLSVNEGGMMDSRLYDLNARTRHQNVLANLRTLAMMHKRVKNAYYPNMTRVLAESMGDLLVRFHDRDLRKTVEAELQRSAKTGSVPEVLEIIDNQVRKGRDRDMFRRAMREYAALREEYRLLEMGMKDPRTFGVDSGHMTAAIMSWVFALLIMIMITLFHFVGGQ